MPSPLFRKNSCYPNTVLSLLFSESQVRLGKTTLFCVTILRSSNCVSEDSCFHWIFNSFLNISNHLDAEKETHAILGCTLSLWEAAASLKQSVHTVWFSYIYDCPEPQARNWVPESVNVCKTPKPQHGSSILWPVCVGSICKWQFPKPWANG